MPADEVYEKDLLESGFPQQSSVTSSLEPASARPPLHTISPPGLVYKNSLDCLLKTLNHEGFGALYKGFFPSLGRMVVWNVVFFQLYEWFKKRGAARNQHST